MAAVAQYGLTPNGFVVKQQQQINLEITQAINGALGSNVNLLPQAVFGQLVNIFSEREALLWQLIEAVYSSQYPAGAEGTSVDNILALNNLRRLPATATTTAPTSTAGIPGLICYGVAGTVIPAESIITVQGNSNLQFQTTANITISAAVNAVQLLSTYGGAPTAGSFILTIVDPAGNILTTQTIPYNTTAATTQISWGTTPASGNFYIAIGSLVTTQLAWNSSQSAIQSAIQALAGYSGVTVSGSIAAGLVLNWGTLSQPIVQTNSTLITFGTTPTSGAYVIDLNGLPSASLTYNSTASQIQTALQAITGFSTVTVTGNITSGFFIQWGFLAPAAVTIPGGSNTTGVTITAASSNTLNQTTTVLNSLQCFINNLYDSTAGNFPYTDVSVAGSFSAFPSGFTFTFGALTALGSNPVSSGQAQATFLVPAASNSLSNSSGTVGLNCVTSTIGAVAQGTGTATCTATGPNFVPATFLNVIGSPITGWTSVNNPLDCITGTNVEDDTAAITRRANLLAAQANGPIQAIVEKVEEVEGVVQARGFENYGLAAQQIISFTGTPSAGSFTLSIQNIIQTLTTAAIPWNAAPSNQSISFSATPSSGSFTITLGLLTTAAIAYNNISAATIQAAIQALNGYSNVQVTGSLSLGFIVSFGFYSQLPIVVNNSLVGATATVVNSVQSFINKLSGYSQALVTGSFATGFVIAFNGSNGGQPQILFTSVNSLTGVSAITIIYGRAATSFEILVNDNNGEASNSSIAQAIYGSKPAGMMTYGSTSTTISDAFGNPYQINFSRPTQIPIYVQLILTTDLTTNPVPTFQIGSIATIQEDIVEVGSLFGIGGTVLGFGTNGLIGAFNSVPGITAYTLNFGTAPNPTSNAPLPMQQEQVPQFETFLVQVAYQ